MAILGNTKANRIFIEILKTIKETDWVGNTTFETLDPCVTSINLESNNSGLYIPTLVRIKGIKGTFLINQDGSLLFDFRVIKTEKGFLKETLSTDAYNSFEQLYIERDRL